MLIYILTNTLVMNRFLTVTFFFFILAFATAVEAQKPADLKRAGEKKFADEQWAEALDLLDQYQQAKPGDLEILTRIGICNYHLHQPEKARQYFEFVLQKNPKTTSRSLQIK